MDTEGLGPSSEDTGLPASEETGQSSADQFESFIKKGEAFAPSIDIVGLEKENLFVIANDEKRDMYYRDYFAQARVQRRSEGDEVQNEDEEVTFQRTAEVFIEGTQGISLSKKGRPAGVWDETEVLVFSNEFREDKTQYDLHYSLVEIKQDDRDIKPGHEGSSISVSYNPEGELFFVSLKHKDLPDGANLTTTPFMDDDDNTEAMEEIRQAAEKGKILEASGIKLGVAYSTDRKNFVFTMYNKQGETDYTVIVPLHLMKDDDNIEADVTEIMEETGALNILRNPTQPSEGIQGQGIGDTDWRYKSFSQLTGVRLTAARI